MGLLLGHLKQTCTIGGQSVACRAERAERVGGGGFYYQTWTIYLEQKVTRGQAVTVADDAAGDVVQDVREIRDIAGVVVGYKAIIGNAGV